MSRIIILMFCAFTSLLCVTACCPDEEKNNATISFKWFGTEDLLKFTHPIITLWNYPQSYIGDTITTTSWEKTLSYQDFDSIMVYAIATYPRIEQLPDTAGKIFVMGNLLSAGISGKGEGGHSITQITALDGIDSFKQIRGGDLKHYLDSLSGITDQVGFVVYRDGRVRDKVKYEELNWRK